MKRLIVRLAKRILNNYALEVDMNTPLVYQGKQYRVALVTQDVVPTTEVSTLVIKAHSKM